jgi:hypothetical protein
MSQTLTILTSATGRYATKQWKRGGEGAPISIPHSKDKWFHWREAPIDGVESIAVVIEELDAYSLIIRGKAHPDKRGEERLRRQNENFGGAGGSVACQWVMIDLDGIALPPMMDIIDDPEDAIEWAISEFLPAPFQDVSAFWQLSSSAGIKEGLSAHIFFWLDRPVTGGAFKDYIGAKATDPAKIDLALFSDVQAHYVAAPIFEDIPDPIPCRSGLMEREHDFATLPELIQAELKQQAKANGTDTSALEGADFEDCLSKIGNGAGLDGFHLPIRQAVMAAVRGTAVMAIDDAALKTRIRQAIAAAPKAPGRDVSRYRSDDYLDQSIAGALTKRRSEYIQADTPLGDFEPVSLAEGEAQLQGAVDKFFAAYDAYNKTAALTPTHGIAGEGGLGKSRRTLKALAGIIEQGARVHYYIPVHRLAEEIVDSFAKLTGITARIHRGREREETMPDGTPMCFEDVRKKADKFGEAGLSVWDHFCKTCTHKGTCGWSRQKADKAPGLIVMPVQYAFEESAQQADLQIFDESFWQASISGNEPPLASLMTRPSVPSRGTMTILGGDDDATAALADAREKLTKALSLAENGVPTIPQLREAGIDAELARNAKAIEYRRAGSIAGHLDPKQSVEEMGVVIDNFQHADGRAWGAIWGTIEKQIDLDRKRLHGVRRYDKDGDPRLWVQYSRDIKAPDIPTLILDATLDESITRRFFPGLECITRIAVETPEGTIKVRQIKDRAVSKTMMAPDYEKTDPKELKRQQNNAQRLLHITEMEAAKRETVGLVTYKATEQEIEAQLPDNVIHDHFNNTRGRNAWENVDGFICAGRTLPKVWDAEMQAEAIHYQSPTDIQCGQYGETLRAIRTRSGDRLVETTAHPDRLVEAVRWQICEAEVLQNFHRTRGIRREADKPCTILIATNVPIPVWVDEFTEWDKEVPHRMEVAATREVVLENSADLALAYPDLFPNTDAVKFAKKSYAARTGYSSYKKLIIGELPRPLTEVTYQRQGAGQKPKTAYFDPLRVADPEAWLTERLGDLSRCFVTHKPETEEAPLDALDGWQSGLVPMPAVAMIGEIKRSTGMTQEAMAQRIGLSRPHLANALQGRFGLAPDIVSRFKAFLREPPPLLQPRLI